MVLGQPEQKQGPHFNQQGGHGSTRLLSSYTGGINRRIVVHTGLGKKHETLYEK
jgi:hypothetical protein